MKKKLLIWLSKNRYKQKKTISTSEAEEIIKEHSTVEKPHKLSHKKKETKKAKKMTKSLKDKKKIRKK